MQASFHRIKLPDGPSTGSEDDGKVVPVSPEQEAAMKRHLAEAQERLKARFSKNG